MKLFSDIFNVQKYVFFKNTEGMNNQVLAEISIEDLLLISNGSNRVEIGGFISRIPSEKDTCNCTNCKRQYD